MKKTLRFLSYFISLAGLWAICFFNDITPAADVSFFIPYLLCALLCPLLGLVPLSKVVLGILGGGTVVSFCLGIPLGMALGNPLVSYVFLFLGTFCLGTRIVFLSLPASTFAEAHLCVRGVPAPLARRVTLFRSALAFFFEKSGILAGILLTFQLFFTQSASLDSLWSAAVLTLAISFIGFLLYVLLGAPEAAEAPRQTKKKRYVLPVILIFILLIVFFYVYIGYAYTSPDPALQKATSAVQDILTPALCAAAIAFPAGMLLGFFLSVCGARFFGMVCGSFLLFPTSLSSSILYMLIPSKLLALALPLVLLSTRRMIESRLAVRPYRKIPMPGRKKAAVLPLFHLANLSLLPRLLACSIFSSLFIEGLDTSRLFSLSGIALAFAGSILASILVLLYILCFVTKEARRYE